MVSFCCKGDDQSAVQVVRALVETNPVSIQNSCEVECQVEVYFPLLSDVICYGPQLLPVVRHHQAWDPYSVNRKKYYTTMLGWKTR